jgi:hypothetical protein
VSSQTAAKTCRRSARLLWSYLRHQRWKLHCEHCKRRFLPGDVPHGYSSSDRKWHDVCMSYGFWRNKAEERLVILDFITDVWSIDAQTVREAFGLRDQEPASRGWDKAWRVFYDLENSRKAKAGR